MRSTKYIIESFTKILKYNPQITSDYDIKHKLDVSFISMGEPVGNFKSENIIINDANELIVFDGNDFKSKLSNISIKFKKESNYDYGIILKINPKQFPNRNWFLCAGLGEYGTSGAAWFLSNKWNQLYKEFKNTNFATIVKVKPGQDESALMVFATNDKNDYRLKKPEDIEIILPDIDVENLIPKIKKKK